MIYRANRKGVRYAGNPIRNDSRMRRPSRCRSIDSHGAEVTFDLISRSYQDHPPRSRGIAHRAISPWRRSIGAGCVASVKKEWRLDIIERRIESARGGIWSRSRDIASGEESAINETSVTFDLGIPPLIIPSRAEDENARLPRAREGEGGRDTCRWKYKSSGLWVLHRRENY